MILRSPKWQMPEWLMWTFAGIWIVIALPVIVPVGALVGVVWIKRKAIGPGEAWVRWFAWYPVKVRIEDEDGWSDTQWRWLEIIERQSFGMMNDTLFRPCGSAWEYRSWWS